MPLILEIISGPLTGKSVVAEAHQVVRVGRTAKSDIPTQDSFMSGEHFAVEGDGKVWRIRDLKSRNGTKINGQVIASAELREGDQVHAGSTDFVVKIRPEKSKDSQRKHDQLMATLPPSQAFKESLENVAAPELPSSTATGPPAAAPTAERPSKHKAAESSKPSSAVRSRRVSQGPPIKAPGPRIAPTQEPPTKSPLEQPVTSPTPPPSAIESYEAATPAGRLLRLLSNQAESLMALLDATHKSNLLKLLAESGEEFQALYQDPKSAAIAPYLVRLPPQSRLLKQMVHEGWGHGWGVYLTCKLPLTQLRDYFRHSLMVRLPDGVELFSRFYDPRFFRAFLEGCTAAEAEKFFGPVSSYLMEAEKPEILLQFTRTSRGAEKKGHLLSTLE
jgi:pSer/pThr/pTyr-binding forkhead associated (FHA) protein